MKIHLQKIAFCLILLCALPFFSLAQDSRLIKPLQSVNPWFVGIGTNIVQDNGSPFFNIPPFPSRLVGGKQLNQYITLEGSFSYNKYITTTKVNDVLFNTNITFFSFDIQGQFDLPQFNTMTQNLFNPYITVGAGFTNRAAHRYPQVTTSNIGLGFYSWIRPRWGIQVQSLAKFGNTTPFLSNNANYLHHSLSVVYQFIPYDRNVFSKRKHPEVRKKRRYNGKTM